MTDDHDEEVQTLTYGGHEVVRVGRGWEVSKAGMRFKFATRLEATFVIDNWNSMSVVSHKEKEKEKLRRSLHGVSDE